MKFFKENIIFIFGVLVVSGLIIISPGIKNIANNENPNPVATTNLTSATELKDSPVNNVLPSVETKTITQEKIPTSTQNFVPRTRVINSERNEGREDD